MDKSFTVRPITCIYKTDQLPFQAHFYFFIYLLWQTKYLRKFCCIF